MQTDALACARPAHLLLLAMLLALASPCRADAPASVRGAQPLAAVPGEAAVAAAIAGDGQAPGAEVASLYELPEPTRLRPCCAFGLDLKVTVGPVPVPGFSIETVRGLEDVGMHEYAAGLVQLVAPVESPPQKERPSRENNGIAYSCRGGFLDTAHVRDYADLTAYLAAQVHRHLQGGGIVELADQGGTRRVVLRALDAQGIGREDRIALSVAIAQWLAFELSVWREIATWYGHESVPPWPETISSFSLEDLYSNLLGTRLAGGVLLAGEIRSQADYDRAMSTWLPAALSCLGIVPKQSAAAAMRAVDGIWWDSTRKVPDWKLVQRRRFDRISPLQPWLIEMAGASNADVGCSGAGPVIGLHRVERFGNVRIADFAAVEVIVGDKLVDRGLPLPRAGDRRVTQDDFGAIIERIRQEVDAGLGKPSGRPEPDGQQPPVHAPGAS